MGSHPVSDLEMEAKWPCKLLNNFEPFEPIFLSWRLHFDTDGLSLVFTNCTPFLDKLDHNCDNFHNKFGEISSPMWIKWEDLAYETKWIELGDLDEFIQRQVSLTQSEDPDSPMGWQDGTNHIREIASPPKLNSTDAIKQNYTNWPKSTKVNPSNGLSYLTEKRKDWTPTKFTSLLSLPTSTAISDLKVETEPVEIVEEDPSSPSKLTPDTTKNQPNPSGPLILIPDTKTFHLSPIRRPHTSLGSIGTLKNDHELSRSPSPSPSISSTTSMTCPLTLPPPKLFKTAPKTESKFWAIKQTSPWDLDDLEDDNCQNLPTSHLKICKIKPIPLKSLNRSRSKSAIDKPTLFYKSQEDFDLSTSTSDLLPDQNSTLNEFRFTIPKKPLQLPPLNIKVKGIHSKLKVRRPKKVRSLKNSLKIWVPVLATFLKNPKRTRVQPAQEGDNFNINSNRGSEEDLIKERLNGKLKINGITERRRSPWLRFVKKWKFTFSLKKNKNRNKRLRK